MRIINRYNKTKGLLEFLMRVRKYRLITCRLFPKGQHTDRDLQINNAETFNGIDEILDNRKKPIYMNNNLMIGTGVLHFTLASKIYAISSYIYY